MKGKEKCKALKEIRRKIAEENDIEYVVSECTHKGDCKGTCPKCEAELRYLERELARKEKLGKAVAVAGIAMTVCTGLTACSPMEVFQRGGGNIAGGISAPIESSVVENKASIEELAGDVTISIDSSESWDDTWEGGLEYIDDDLVESENADSSESESEGCGEGSESCEGETESGVDETLEIEGDIALME